MAQGEDRVAHPVVVGVDGSEASALALEWALQEARQQQTPVRVVTAWAWDAGATSSLHPSGRVVRQARQARQTQETLIRVVLARFPGRLPALTTELVQGDPASTLIERSHDGVLLVLGSQGVSGAQALVGSVADTCLRHGGCPVVVVPAQVRRRLPMDAAPAGAGIGVL